MTSRPDDVDPADLADQQRAVLPGEDDAAPPTPAAASLDEADEADALEQGAEVGIDEEY